MTLTNVPAAARSGRITGSFTAAQLARDIRAGSVTAVDAIEECIRRLTAWQPTLNAVCVPMYERARAAARSADEWQRSGQPLGPLHGVPVTIKECFDIDGTPTTIGLVRRAGHRADGTAPLVERLVQAGAIVVGKTNVPELLLYYESDNLLYGRTCNPWDVSRSPGGSSGGEAAVVGAWASPLGLGSDIGGSIRVPAHFCGVHGLKPTSGRLTMRGVFGDELFPGQEAILDQPGPLARTVEDLTLAMSVLCGEPQAFDEGVPPVPWAEPPSDVRGMRIGFYDDDGVLTPAPAIRRAVQDAAAMLRDAGAELVTLAPPDGRIGLRLYLTLLGADGGSWARTLMGAGPHDRRIADLVRIARLPRAMRPVVAAALRAGGQRRLAELVGNVGALGTGAYWRAVAERTRLRRRFATMMDDAGVDAIVCPPLAHVALRHGDSYWLTAVGSHAMLFNLLGMPAGSCALTRVLRGEEGAMPHSRDLVDRALRATDAESVGLPVGVQVVARHWREDLVLAVMSALEQRARDRDDYPLRAPPLLPGAA